MSSLNRPWTMFLLGLVSLVAVACALPADGPDPNESASAEEDPWGLDQLDRDLASLEAAEDRHSGADWEPSEQWLELYEWDQEVRELMDAAFQEGAPDSAYEEYRTAKRELQDWLVANPGADVPCETQFRWAPSEMWPSPQDCLAERGWGNV